MYTKKCIQLYKCFNHEMLQSRYSSTLRHIRRFTTSKPPAPPEYSSTTKLLYGACVGGGYCIGVQQGVFLDLRDVPTLISRIYAKTLGNKNAPNVLNAAEGKTESNIYTPPTHKNATVTDTVFLDITIGEAAIQRRIEIGLYHDVVPRTCANFEELCVGNQLLLDVSKRLKGRTQTFKGSPFHRIIPNFVIQGGDWTNGDGSGGRSIFKGSKFSDEKGGLNLKHSGPGTLSMANSGPNTNSSQFFITLKATPHLDYKHVVFGKITKGMDVVHEIEKCGNKKGTPPITKVIVTNCGLVSRSYHGTRDLSTRSSKWLTRRLDEMRRMKKEENRPSIQDLSQHEEDMMLLKKLLKERIKNEKKHQTEARETLRQKMGR